MTDEQYYSDKERMTNTMTNWILVGPKYFKKQMALIGLEREAESYFVFGNAVHCRLLEPLEFGNRYFVQSGVVPSNAIQKKFCNLLVAHKDSREKARMNAYRLSYSTSKMKDVDIQKKSEVLYNTFKEYIEAKRLGSGKIELTPNDYARVRAIERNVKSHIAAKRLLLNKGVMSYNEIVVLFDYKEVKMKSKLDRLEIDFDEKVIRLIDVKTHSIKREDSNFSKSFRRAFISYNYHKQMYVYFLAVKRFFEQEFPNENFDNFKFETKIIAIKSNFDNEIIVFDLDGSFLIEGGLLFEEAMEKLRYYETEGFTYSYETDENGEERLGYE